MTTPRAVRAPGADRTGDGHRDHPVYQPQQSAYWWYVALMVVAGVLTFVFLLRAALGGQGTLIVTTMIGWALWAGFLWWLVTRVDLFSWVPTSLRLAALGWGVIVVFMLGGGLNSLIALGRTNLLPGLPEWAGLTITAPLIEEAVKLLGVLLLAGIAPWVLRRLMGGLLVGMLVGLGYSAHENWGFTLGIADYLRGHGADDAQIVSGVLGQFVARGLTDIWGHISYTGIAAVGVVFYLANPDRTRGRRVGVAVGFFVLAWVLHMLWNAAGALPGALAAISPIVSVVATLTILVLLIRRARREERQRFNSALLGQAGTGVITEEEARSMGTLRGRRRHLRASARSDGGKHARERGRALQAAQIGYANALSDHSGEPDAPEVAGARERVEALRGRSPRDAGA